MFDLGDPIPLSVTVKNAAGVAENATSVVLTITLPDGTSSTPAVTNVSAGVYTATGPSTQAGRYGVRWVATGTNASAYTDAYNVDKLATTGIISLATLKEHLRITSTTDDEMLRTFLAAATAPIEQYIGPVVVRTVTETLEDDDAFTLQLGQVPVTSITSVTSIYPTGPTWATAALHVSPESGTVRRLDRGGFYLGPFTVVYAAGRTVVDQAIVKATCIIVQHLWATERGGSKRPGLGGDDVTTPPGGGYAIPNRAAELLEPFAKIGGLA